MVMRKLDTIVVCANSIIAHFYRRTYTGMRNIYDGRTTIYRIMIYGLRMGVQLMWGSLRLAPK